MTLQHRVALSSMIQFRTYAPYATGPQQASYYHDSQRGSTIGSLLITESTIISHDAGGCEHAIGMYTDAQIRSWRKITDAVHAKGSYIFVQLGALGRAADPEVLAKQDPPSPYVSASSIALPGRSRPPRALTEDEIKYYIATYAEAALDAVYMAGFDGVEIDAANGHLIDQFLRTTSNVRTDRWGGDEEGRTRFAREIVDAVVDAIGPERVSVRISPWSTFQDMKMSDPRPTFAYLATTLRDKHPKLAYLHVVESPVVGDSDIDQDKENNDFLREIRNGGKDGEGKIFISTGGYNQEAALHTAKEKGGLIGFGRSYISNPGLPVQLQRNIPLTPSDRSKYCWSGNLTPFGCNDWPFADGTTSDSGIIPLSTWQQINNILGHTFGL